MPAKVQSIVKNLKLILPHTIHVWYIHLHLVDVYDKCREIYHTWILWVLQLRLVQYPVYCWCFMWFSARSHHMCRPLLKLLCPMSSRCIGRNSVTGWYRLTSQTWEQPEEAIFCERKVTKQQEQTTTAKTTNNHHNKTKHNHDHNLATCSYQVFPQIIN